MLAAPSSSKQCSVAGPTSCEAERKHERVKWFPENPEEAVDIDLEEEHSIQHSFDVPQENVRTNGCRDGGKEMTHSIYCD
jgi:hypothetical protein